MYSGIDYKIDISQPAGERVVELMYQGQPVTPDQELVLAINNYRGGGGGGYSMFTEGEVLWKSMSEIRDYMTEYIQEKGMIDPQEYYVNNWTLLPESIYGEAVAAEAPATLPVSGASTSNATASIMIFLLVGSSLIVAGYVIRRQRV